MILWILVRIILTAKISKLQNTSQHCYYLDLPHSLFPGIVVDRTLSLKRSKLFRILEFWSRVEGKERVTNPHLYLERNDLEVIWITAPLSIAFPHWSWRLSLLGQQHLEITLLLEEESVIYWTDNHFHHILWLQHWYWEIWSLKHHLSLGLLSLRPKVTSQ